MTMPHPDSNRRTLVLATLAALVAIVLAALGTLDAWAGREVDAALGRALLAFALARGLNGVISVVQGTQVALQPGGLGLTLSPGEILDPVNDLVEQFSTVMLVASASLGLQKLLLGISAWWPLTLAMALALAGWIVLAWRGHGESRMRRWVRALALVLLALRFAVPLAALGSEAAYRVFLAPEFEASSVQLEGARSGLAERAAAAEQAAHPPPDESLLDRANRWLDENRETLDIKARLQDLQRMATDATRNVIDLIAVFVLQSVLFPLAFAWIAWRALTRWLPRSLA
jgi:hypothetical protein